jgi:GDP/UDP-N,N'-diacetylbacillosamine 2-epimerase (hydrolysing)
MIRVGVLTSSRADFGIYLPLLKRLHQRQDVFDASLIVFGMHLCKQFGYTADQIEEAGFKISYRISSMLGHDDPASISSTYAITALKFADFWGEHGSKFDVVFCLGDRFEMAAAVAAGIPLGIRFAHIHGGETTLGAIDNIYRHSITLASKWHFVSAKPFTERIHSLVGSDVKCFVAGSLSLENLRDISIQSLSELKEQWGIDLKHPSILITIHPETASPESNQENIREVEFALIELSKKWQLIVTMPNADTYGSEYREMYARIAKTAYGNIYLIENFGTLSYFSCMHHCSMLLGNTSSGIIEAATFRKYVIDLGDRQKGRLTSGNVTSIPFNAELMIRTVDKVASKGEYFGDNVYQSGDTTGIIMRALENEFS